MFKEKKLVLIKEYGLNKTNEHVY